MEGDLKNFVNCFIIKFLIFNPYDTSNKMIFAMDCNDERLSKAIVFNTEFENLYYFVEKYSLYFEFALFNVINKKPIVTEIVKWNWRAQLCHCQPTVITMHKQNRTKRLHTLWLWLWLGAWTFILTATLDLLLHTQASCRSMCLDTAAQKLIRKSRQFRHFQDC